MIKNSKPHTSEVSKPDDIVVNPRKPEDASGPSKENGTNKVGRSVALTSPAESCSSDSLWEAGNLLNSIDGIDRKFGSQTKQESTTAHLRSVPTYNVGTLQQHAQAQTKSASQNNSFASKMKSKATSEVQVIDSDDEIDLDALEKWASSSNIKIDWSIERDTIATKNSPPVSVPKAVADKISQSDIAVKELDAILDTISETKNVTKGHCQIIHHARNELQMDRKSAASPFECLSNDISKPTLTWPQPMSAIRLPPLKGSTVANEDIFHRKLNDMPLLHMPRTLPKLDQSGQKQTENVQQCLNKSRSSRLPEKSPVESFVTQSSNHSEDILLPGQVSEVNSDVASKQIIPVRTIILDYSSTSNNKIKKKNRKTKRQKIRGLFSCCQAANDGGKANEFDAENNSKASFEEIQIAIVEEVSQRSLPRRIWARLKSVFGR